MFVVLQTEERSDDFFSRIMEKIAPSEPELLKIAVKNGAPFFVLKVKKRKNGVPWDDVRYAAGRCASRLLLADDVEIPKNSSVHEFVPQYLPFRLIFNSAVEIIKRSCIKPNEISIGVLDRGAELTDRIELATEASSVVRIVTDRLSEYEAVAERTMNQCGASLVIGGDLHMLDNCDVLICRESNIPSTENTLLFAAGNSLEKRNVISCGKVLLPHEYAEIMPDGTNKMKFASALYDMCGVSCLGDMNLMTMCTGEGEMSFYETLTYFEKCIINERNKNH